MSKARNPSHGRKQVFYKQYNRQYILLMNILTDFRRDLMVYNRFIFNDKFLHSFVIIYIL